jgi:hypothetical protein
MPHKNEQRLVRENDSPVKKKSQTYRKMVRLEGFQKTCPWTQVSHFMSFMVCHFFLLTNTFSMPSQPMVDHSNHNLPNYGPLSTPFVRFEKVHPLLFLKHSCGEVFS